MEIKRTFCTILPLDVRRNNLLIGSYTQIHIYKEVLQPFSRPQKEQELVEQLDERNYIYHHMDSWETYYKVSLGGCMNSYHLPCSWEKKYSFLFSWQLVQTFYVLVVLLLEIRLDLLLSLVFVLVVLVAPTPSLLVYYFCLNDQKSFFVVHHRDHYESP